MEANTTEEQIIRGVIKRVTFRNPENGYVVLQLSVPDTVQQLTVVGICHDLREGANVVVRGTVKQHQKFGMQISARTITETAPTSPDGIEKYLGSGLIKGVGEKTAQRLVEAFGTETLEIIHRHPEKVAKVAGIGKRKAEIICQTFAEQRPLREIMQFLIEHDISTRLAQRIYERYQNRAIEVLKKDPYTLAREMKGIGFSKADTIFQSLHGAEFKPESPQRLKAGLYYALEKASDDGHCYLPIKDLVQKALLLLGLGEGCDLSPQIADLVKEGYVVQEDDGLFLKPLHRAEEFVAEFIASRCGPLENPEIDEATVRKCLTAASDDLGVRFSFEQEQAVLSATRYPLMVITGGPGCGKTTIIKAVSLLFKMTGKRLLLAAPTGRAAQRMSQVCGLPASTIHRLLKFDPMKGRFLHGVNEPLLCDALIIDEASMIDIQLAQHLFSAIPRQAIVILVGDKDQLPSVGPGRLFGDLISVADLKTVSLSQLFRRSSESTINAIAHQINAGITPDIPEPDGVTKVDAYFIPRSDAAEALSTIEKLVSDQIPRKFGIDIKDIVVLTPSNRGDLGTQTLNKRIQDRINPSGSIDPEQEITYNETEFRVRDRVCQRVNNYQLDAAGVFNGDVGEVYKVSRKDRKVTVELWDGRLVDYDYTDLSQLSLAYAITVHRSQGSEIPCVVLALHESHFNLLERQLIYTAVTRAKKLLIVVGSKRALSIASRRMSAKRRYTMLQSRIQRLLR